MTPYPKWNESHESWIRRCDDYERERRQEQEGRWASSPNGRGLTDKQAAKLAKVQAKLPQGWKYTVTNDNQQICLAIPLDSSAGCATKMGKRIDAGVSGKGECGAVLALLLNRATAAVWGWQASWYECFSREEWKAAYHELAEGLPSYQDQDQELQEEREIIYSNDTH